jgi:hypothetical protein
MEINGLPLHPLVVHAVVVLSPLAALTGLAFVLALGAALAAVLSTASGEALVEARPGLEPLVEEHEDWGELLRTASLAYAAAAALGAWALGGPSALVSGRGARGTNRVVGGVAAVLVTAGAAAVLVLVFLAGESGARAVWG